MNGPYRALPNGFAWVVRDANGETVEWFGTLTTTSEAAQRSAMALADRLNKEEGYAP